MNYSLDQTISREMPSSVLDLLQQELEATNRENMLLTLELEERVAARTAELSTANQKLLKEVAERIRAEGEIKRLNRDLQHRAEMLTAANEELDAFSASVSHDLRNPLAKILDCCWLLDKGVSSRLNESEKAFLDGICDSAKRMAALIDDLLRLSRDSQVELTRTSIDLNKLLESILAELEPSTRSRTIVWERRKLPNVEADASLLRQVLVNLISNALKYTGPRNPAHIEIGTVSGSPDESVIFVKDNGVGFDPKQAPKLFHAFQRLDKEAQFEGTGVGLVTVQRIVRRHGGKVWADGVLDEGATFYFSIPNTLPDSA